MFTGYLLFCSLALCSLPLAKDCKGIDGGLLDDFGLLAWLVDGAFRNGIWRYFTTVAHVAGRKPLCHVAVYTTTEMFSKRCFGLQPLRSLGT